MKGFADIRSRADTCPENFLKPTSERGNGAQWRIAFVDDEMSAGIITQLALN